MKGFYFSQQALNKARKILLRYPRVRSATVPLLRIAQEENSGWLSPEAMQYVANWVGISYAQVYEVASFYSMFNLERPKQYLIQICTTPPCSLKGNLEIVRAFQEPGSALWIKENCTLKETSCVGRCTLAPVCRINSAWCDSASFAMVLQTLKSSLSKT